MTAEEALKLLDYQNADHVITVKENDTDIITIIRQEGDAFVYDTELYLNKNLLSLPADQVQVLQKIHNWKESEGLPL